MKNTKKSFGEIWSELNDEQTEYLKEYINKQRRDAVEHYKSEQLRLHGVMQKKFSKYFKLYKEVKRELNYYVSMRGSSFGVGVGTDEYAVKWQGKQMRLEILEAFLEGRNPNWYFAYYLNNEERDRRNQSYCA